MSARPGSALIAAIIVLLVLDCVLLGTLHLATLERRLAVNVETALRLRLAAQSAAHGALARWPAHAASLDVGTRLAVPAESRADGLVVAVFIERVDTDLYLVRSDAAQPPPMHGRASSGILTSAPPLDTSIDPIAAAISAAVPPEITSPARITAATAACNVSGDALRLGDWLAATSAAHTGVQGSIGVIADGADPAALLTRIAASARRQSGNGTYFIDGDFVVTSDLDTVLIVTGDLNVPAGTALRGLVFVGGTLRIDAGATVEGAIHVAGAGTISGDVRFDGCAARRALDRSSLQRARPLPGRSVIPTF